MVLNNACDFECKITNALRWCRCVAGTHTWSKHDGIFLPSLFHYFYSHRLAPRLRNFHLNPSSPHPTQSLHSYLLSYSPSTMSNPRKNQRSKQPTTLQANHAWDFAKEVDAIIDSNGQGTHSSASSAHKQPSRSKTARSLRPSAQPARCCECRKMLSSRGNLNRHVRMTHEGRRIYCTVSGCGNSFGQAHDLRRHMRRKHSEKWWLLLYLL